MEGVTRAFAKLLICREFYSLALRRGSGKEWYQLWYETFCNQETGEKYLNFSGSGRGTRTPDPRIMIPVL